MSFTIKKTKEAVLVRNPEGLQVMGYQIEKPANSKLSVDSACYFHPLTTPKGVAITEVAPADHLHHRGIFLAFVEMHGRKSADFWGWGEHAPKSERKIINQQVSGLEATPNSAGFEAINLWQAEGETILREELSCKFTPRSDGHLLDLSYRLIPEFEIKLAQWAFSGFCVRTRRDGKLTAFSPQGEIKLPNPKHTEPKSDWPDERWYGCQLDLREGVASVAVENGPGNPSCLWHNHRDVYMINPCLVAKEPLTLPARKPMNLRYRVAVWDEKFETGAVERILT